jgi:hypothetical protein
MRLRRVFARIHQGCSGAAANALLRSVAVFELNLTLPGYVDIIRMTTIRTISSSNIWFPSGLCAIINNAFYAEFAAAEGYLAV